MTHLPCPFCDCAQVTVCWESVFPVAQCVACGARGSRRIRGGGERVICTEDAFDAWDYRPSEAQGKDYEEELEELQKCKDDAEVEHLQYVKDLEAQLKADHEWEVSELNHRIADLEFKLQQLEGEGSRAAYDGDEA